jgi:hypothetical protein
MTMANVVESTPGTYLRYLPTWVGVAMFDVGFGLAFNATVAIVLAVISLAPAVVFALIGLRAHKRRGPVPPSEETVTEARSHYESMRRSALVMTVFGPVLAVAFVLYSPGSALAAALLVGGIGLVIIGNDQARRLALARLREAEAGSFG